MMRRCLRVLDIYYVHIQYCASTINIEHIEYEVVEHGRPKISLQRSTMHGRWTWDEKNSIVLSVVGRLSRRNPNSPMWYQKGYDRIRLRWAKPRWLLWYKYLRWHQPVSQVHKYGTQWRSQIQLYDGKHKHIITEDDATLSKDSADKDSHWHWRGAVHTGTDLAHTKVTKPKYLFEFRNLEDFYRSRSALAADRRHFKSSNWSDPRGSLSMYQIYRYTLARGQRSY